MSEPQSPSQLSLLFKVISLQRFAKRWIAKRQKLKQKAVEESRETALHALKERERLLQAAIHAGKGNVSEALDESGILDQSYSQGDTNVDQNVRLWLEFQLRNIPLLASCQLSKSELATLSRAMRVRKYQQGDILISQGDAVRHLMIIQEGSVEVLQRLYNPSFASSAASQSTDDTPTSTNEDVNDPEMREDPNTLPVFLREIPSKRIGVLGVGQSIGDQALLGYSSSLFSVVATGTLDTVCWQLSRRDLVSLIGSDRLKPESFSFSSGSKTPTQFQCILSKVRFACPLPNANSSEIETVDESLARGGKRASTIRADPEMKVEGTSVPEYLETELRSQTSVDSLIVALQRSPLLRSFRKEELLTLMSDMRLVSVPHGDVVIRSGADPHAMFVVACGSARVYVPEPEVPLGGSYELAKELWASQSGVCTSIPENLQLIPELTSSKLTPITIQKRLLQRRASLAAGTNAMVNSSSHTHIVGKVDAYEIEKIKQDCEEKESLFKSTLSKATLKAIYGSSDKAFTYRRELYPGEIFGDVSFMLKCKRTATIVASDPLLGSNLSINSDENNTTLAASRTTVLWTLPFECLQRFLQQSSQTTRDLVEGCLRRVPEFAGLTADEVSRAAEALESVSYSKGKCIVREGAPGKTFFIIKSGQVQVVKARLGTQGSDKADQMVEGVQIALLGPGEYFGERALLMNQPRQASCIALTDVECYYLHSMNFHAVFGKARTAMLAKMGLSEKPPGSPLQPSIAYPLPEFSLASKNGEEKDTVLNARRIHASLITPPRHITRRTSMAFSDGSNFGLKGWTSVSAQNQDDSKNSLPINMTPMIQNRSLQRRGSVSLVPAQATSVATLALYNINDSNPDFGPGAFLCREPERWRALLPAYLRTTGFSRVGAFRFVAQTFACDLYADFLVCDTVAEGKGYCLRIVSREVFMSLPTDLRKRFATACAMERDIVHPFISKTYCSIEDHVPCVVASPPDATKRPNAACVLRDFAHAGSIADLLERGHFRGKRVLDDHGARFVVASVILALEALHASRIVYRNITPSSLVVTRAGYVRLTDFTFAKQMPSGSRTYTVFESMSLRGYTAPEQIFGSGYSGFGVDWWTLGCLTFELLAGYPPFFDPDPRVALEAAVSGEVQHWPSTIGGHARSFISQLLQPRPHKRLGVLHDSSKLLRSHPWFSTPCTVSVSNSEMSAGDAHLQAAASEPNVVSVATLFERNASGLNPLTRQDEVDNGHEIGADQMENDSAFAEAAVYASLPFPFASLAMQVMPSPLDPGVISGDDLSSLRVGSYLRDTNKFWKCPDSLSKGGAYEIDDELDSDWARLF